MTDATRDALLALAERCEQASGPDRELDGEIARALGWTDVHVSVLNPLFQVGRPPGVTGWRDPVPAFTASLDAALTLVPEGWRVNGADWSILGQYSWMLKGPCKKLIMGADGYEEAGGDWFKSGVSLATPALALCAAALRALASEVGQ